VAGECITVSTFSNFQCLTNKKEKKENVHLYIRLYRYKPKLYFITLTRLLVQLIIYILKYN